MEWSAMLEGLRHPDPTQRIHALRLVLTQVTAQEREVWERIEWMALYDTDPRVRLVALAALLTPEGQRYYSLWLPTLSPERFQERKRELQERSQAGIIDPAAAAVLLDFMEQYQPEPMALQVPEEPLPAPEGEAVSPSPEGQPAAPAARPAPRGQVPQGTGWLQVLIYVGAFLVAAVSLLLAQLPGFNLPVLLGSTLVFFALAAVLAWWFRPGSAVFYGLATFYLWADAFALLNAFPPPTDQARFFVLFLTTVLVSFLWALGTWLYRSRAFAMLTAVAFPLGGLWLALALLPEDSPLRPLWAHAFIQGMMTLQWAWVAALRRWEPRVTAGAQALARGFTLLHGLVFAGLMGMYAMMTRDAGLTLEAAFPAGLTWALMAVSWMLAGWSRTWGWLTGLGLAWSLFFGALVPRVFLDLDPGPLLWVEALAALVLNALALGLARFVRRGGLAWPPGLAAWALWWLVVWPKETAPLTLFAWLWGMAALGLMGLWLFWQPRLGVWMLWLLLFIRVYFTGLEALTLTEVWSSTTQWFWLALVLGGLPPLWRRLNRASWAWGTLVVHGFVFMVAVGMLLNTPARWTVVLAWLAFTFLFWAWSWLWPSAWWFLPGVVTLFIGQGFALALLDLGPLWPLTYLPYPLAFLAVEYGLRTMSPTPGREAWRQALLWSLWGTLLFLGTLAFILAEHPATVVLLSVWALVAGYTIWAVRSPWPGVLTAWLFLLTVAMLMRVGDVASWPVWMSLTFGMAAVFLYVLFRRFQRWGWHIVWALLGQGAMYALALGYWLSREWDFLGFLLFFGEGLAALLLGVALRSGSWLWPGLTALLLGVSVLLLVNLGGIGVLLVLCLTGMLLLGGGLLWLYRRSQALQRT